MGINDLLNIYKPLLTQEHISILKKKTCAIDIMVWLYKGVYASLNNQKEQNEKNDIYLNYPLKMISLLLSFDIKCICVFDGKILKAKQKEITNRNLYKETSKKLAEKLEKEGKEEESKKIFNRTLKTKSRMINSLIEILKKLNQKVIISPYESDAEISYLYKEKKIDFAITEDSDLIPYGVKKIVFKLDPNGNCEYLDLEKKYINYPNYICKFLLNIPKLKLIQFCVMLGCDYLPQIKGFGCKSAFKIFSFCDSIDDVVYFLKNSGKYQFENNDDNNYIIKAKNACAVFLYQTIYDIDKKILRPLIRNLDYERGIDNVDSLKEKVFVNDVLDIGIDKSYFGEFFDNCIDFCEGNLDVKTLLKEKKTEKIENINKYYIKYKRIIDIQKDTIKNENPVFLNKKRTLDT
jgi:exonuclease-1